MMIQELDETVVGKTIRVVGRRPMKVLEITQGKSALHRVKLKVIIDRCEREVEIRQDTEVLEVDMLGHDYPTSRLPVVLH
jgi:hypothetical protein